MKKTLALVLTALLTLGVLASFPALTARAEGLETPVWTPVEITLTAAVKYKNPYKDTEIDAVFTHTDGTVITLPGFWDGSQTWKVRFSPTKTGTWNYKITCKNAEDTGLFQEGSLTAVPYTGDNPNQKHGMIQTDGRHFTYADGTPFFWLGDTNWSGPSTIANNRCNYPGCDCGNQMKHLIDDRASKGFTVFQTYFSAVNGYESEGNKSYWSTACSKVNPKTFDDRIDYLFQHAFEQGMVVATGFGCHNGTFTEMKEEDYQRLIRYCVARYACYNIAWITGQEITRTVPSEPNNGKEVMSIYMDGAALTGKLDGYKHPNSCHMDVMMYSDPKAQRLEKADWHNWWALQGGHSNLVKEKRFYQSYYASAKKNPYIEGECNYEEINCGGFVMGDTPRKCAWKALLSGGCGYPYGVSGIWVMCYATETYTAHLGATSSYSYEPWYMGIDKPGSFEMSYMKEFFSLLPDWTQLVPRFYDTSYASFLKDETAVLASTEDGTVNVCYFYASLSKTGTLKKLDAKKSYSGYWFDPRTGAFLDPVTLSVAADGTCELPEKPSKQDWILLVTSEKLSGQRTEAAYTDAGTFSGAGEQAVFASVRANGGITYTFKGSRATVNDPTQALIDNDPATVWKPYSDRTSQTFLLDLGECRNLSGIKVTPAENTVLPGSYRVEGSNDGKTWTILVNSEERENRKTETEAISDALTGAYRYVKLLLMNPDIMRKVDAEKKPYKTFYNEYTGNSYSVLEIADLAVYTLGAATPEPTQAPDEPDVPAEPDQTAAPAKSGCGAALLPGTMVLLITSAVVFKKKKEN